jgi:hypothetical protein
MLYGPTRRGAGWSRRGLSSVGVGQEPPNALEGLERDIRPRWNLPEGSDPVRRVGR